jgi:hypothetical protein
MIDLIDPDHLIGLACPVRDSLLPWNTLGRNSTLSPSVRPTIAPRRELRCKDGAWLLKIRRGLRSRPRLV